MGDTSDFGRFGEIELEDVPNPDRLPPMLFLAALIHGILIIGVTFNAITAEDIANTVSLEITIVADPDLDLAEPDEAQYLAQANQSGDGNTLENARPSAAALSSVPVDNAGVVDGDSLQDSVEQFESADQIVTAKADAERRVADHPREIPAPDASTAITMERGVETTLPLPQKDDATFLIRDQNLDRIDVSANSRESNIAEYANRWISKIESVGSRYLPEQVDLRGVTGDLYLQVTVYSSGQLGEVVIVQSSGSRLLDKAALNILRRAAPFDPFPESVRIDHPNLNFSYVWRFDSGAIESAVATGS
ncbi:MAG: TonB family protein [Gammaproteobacteria bacterium]|nr:TonB family protein [Gammaproteobacteria bacterium]